MAAKTAMMAMGTKVDKLPSNELEDSLITVIESGNSCKMISTTSFSFWNEFLWAVQADSNSSNTVGST